MNNQEVNDYTHGKSRFFYGYIVVAVALLIMLLAYGTRISFGIFFKPMLADFDWTRALTSGAFTLSMIVQGILGIYMGRLNDKIGPRVVMTSCCFFLGLGFLLLSQINHSWQLYLFYGVIVGIGMGGVIVALLSTVARWFVKRRGTMTGIVLAGMGIGTLIVSPVSNQLIFFHGWRVSYVIVGGVVLVVGILAAQFLRRDPAKMGLVPYGENKGEQQKLRPGVEGLSLKEAAYTRQFWMVAAVFFCLGYCVFTINVHLVPHVTDLSISAANAANILAVTGGIQIIGNVVLGGAADRIGNKIVLAISFILIAIALFWLVPVKAVWMLYLFAIIFGLGVGGGAVIESTVIAELFGIKYHGLLLGVISFIFTIGGAVGPLLTGYLFDITGNYHTAFLICASIGVAGFILSVLLNPIRKKQVKLNTI